MLLKWAITLFIAYYMYRFFIAPAKQIAKQQEDAQHLSNKRKTTQDDEGEFIDYEEIE